MHERVKYALKRLQETFIPWHCKNLYIVFGVTILVIAMYFIVIRYFLNANPEKSDILNRTVFTLNGESYSWWPLSHLIFFYFIGIFFPRCTVPAITAGILWELVELIVSTATQQAVVLDDGTVQYNTWWGPSFADIVFNIVGFFLGKITRIEIENIISGCSSSGNYESSC